jgi:hypothetical protein
MNVGLNATQARSKANSDLVIFDEIQYLMKEIITQSGVGSYSATIADGTTMTDSTPDIITTGTIANPTVVVGETIIWDGTTITLGTSGTSLNALIADINDASVSGLVASKNASNNLVLTQKVAASTVWQTVIGSGTANNNVGITGGTYTATNPSSVTYYTVWLGTTTNRGYKVQMDHIVKYFQNLGYRIERSANTSTNTTFQWNINW